jgi:hypothetical protein
MNTWNNQRVSEALNEHEIEQHMAAFRVGLARMDADPDEASRIDALIARTDSPMIGEEGEEVAMAATGADSGKQDRRITIEARQEAERIITDTNLAPRQDAPFDCPNDHRFTVPFAAESERPHAWECRVCGAMATAATGEMPSPAKTRSPRSRWEMLVERHSITSLEDAIEERLATIRDRRSGMGHSADAEGPSATRGSGGTRPVKGP